MRRMSKEYLTGRVVGYSIDHKLDPSQYDEGAPATIERTVWARITDFLGLDPTVFVGRNIHTNTTELIPVTAIHTVMPRKYYEYL